MSRQSIENINHETVFVKTQNNLLKSQQKCTMYECFRLGKEESADVIEHNLIMYEILRQKNCSTVDLLNALLQPNFEKTKYTVKNGIISIENNENRLYQIWLSKGNSGTIEDFYNVLTENPTDNLTIWEDVEW